MEDKNIEKILNAIGFAAIAIIVFIVFSAAIIMDELQKIIK